MLARLAQKISVFLAEHQVIDSKDLAIYSYSIEMLLASGMIWLALGTIAIAGHAIVPSLFYFVGFYLMRSVAGGYHATNHFRCAILTVATYGIFVWLSRIIPTGSERPLNGILIMVALVCIWCYGPVEHVNKPFSPNERQRYRRKSRCRIAFFSLLIVLGSLVGLERLMLYLALGITQAAIFVAIAYHLTREAKNYEETTI